MQIKVLREAGHEEALLGLSLSFYDHAIPLEIFWDEQKKLRAAQRGTALAHRDGGHNKFLESIQVWIFIQASRDFWSEMDTYRAGMTKQSSSTMHTLDKRYVTHIDFEEGTSSGSIYAFNRCLEDYKTEGNQYFKDITRLKKNLPEGWLQERVICTNYKVLQHIYKQRNGHRLKQWKHYIEELTAQLEFPEYMVQKDG